MTEFNNTVNEENAVYCRKCGNKIVDNSAFCPKCGTPVNGDIPNDDTNRKSSYDVGSILAFVAIGIALFSSFMPFMTYNVLGITKNYTLWDSNFIIFTLFGFLLLILAFVSVAKKKKSRGRDARIVGLIFPADMIVEYFYNKTRLSETKVLGSKYDLSNLLKPGVGFYLVLAGSILLIVSGFMMREKK